MGIVLDIIIIAIIVLSTLLAYKKGLAALAIKLCAVIISIIATLILYKPISNFIINTTNIDETIQNAVYEQSFKLMSTENPDDLTAAIIDQTATTAIQNTAKDLSIQIINVGVIVILYFGIKFALKFVTVIADKVASLPILNKLNKIGGIIYGLVRGLIIVYACLLLISFIGRVNPKNFLFITVEESNVGKLMYENNVFNALL